MPSTIEVDPAVGGREHAGGPPARPGLLARRAYGRYRARVDPTSIRYVKTSDEWPSYLDWWPFLHCPGGWDLHDEELAPFRVRQMRQLFVEGRHYTETDEYGRLLEQLRVEGVTRFPRCRSLRDIESYFEGVQRLYESMKEHGCLPPSPGAEGPSDGITVRISRDGELLKCNQGTHRLAIARLLRLRTVPVVVDLVHLRRALGRRRPPDGGGADAPGAGSGSGSRRRAGR